MLAVQVLLHLVVALDVVDYAVVIPILGLNYLSTRSPQMLWAYVLLTLFALPLDISSLMVVAERWKQCDAICHTSGSAFSLIVCSKLVLLLGMFMFHTQFHLRLRLLEPDTGHGT